jgi:hypothetical protein
MLFWEILGVAQNQEQSPHFNGLGGGFFVTQEQILLKHHQPGLGLSY